MKSLEIEFDGRQIHLSKMTTIYDSLALKFSRIMEEASVSHVFVSGYVAILFGRSRTSENVDVLVERMSFESFSKLWDRLLSEFECHNAKGVKTAYYDYLEEKLALRFSEKDTVLPNIEFKWAVSDMHRKALDERLTVHLDQGSIPISPLEIQIAFKLYLGSDKDIEDARYLFELFREKFDLEGLEREIMNLELPLMEAKKDLGWT